MSDNINVFSMNLWNLNGDFKARMDIVDRWVKQTQPDIALLQEVSPAPGSARLQSDLVFAGDQAVRRLYASQYQWGDREEGLCIITRYPVVAVESLILPEADNDGQRRALVAVLEVGQKRLLVANTHLAFHIEQDEMRCKQARRLLTCIREAQDYYLTNGTVLAGDFNAVPESTAIAAITRGDPGLTDLFAGTELRRHQSTWCARNPFVNDSNSTDRWIDYIFHSTELKSNSQSLALNGDASFPFASDHVALQAELAFI